MKWRWPHKKELSQAIAAHATPRSGGTYRIGSVPYENSAVPYAREWRAETVEHGYAVAAVRGPVVEADGNDDLWEYISQFHDFRCDDFRKAGRCLGLWYHEGLWHIDCIDVLFDKSMAIERAAWLGELAIYDLVIEKTIFLEESE